MRLYKNINTRLKDEETQTNGTYTYNVEIETDGIKAFGLSIDEYAKVMQALAILNHKRFKEEEK